MASDHSRSAETVWQTAYGELQLQMPRETFDTWLRSARLVAHEDGTFIIGVHNAYAREWLEHRLKKLVVRTLTHIAGHSVEVRFVIWTERPSQPDLREAGPLLATLESEKPEPSRFEQLRPGETGLNPRYTFDDYAVGSSNRMAHAAALNIIETPGVTFNPLYIHAGVGLGKTHLLHAVGNACAMWERRALFVSAERFTNDLVAAIQRKKTADFRDKYRAVEILLIDDIEFIAGKDSTQEEFYHTFNTLTDGGAQIVVASNLPPSTVRRFDPRLVSRFEGGLVVEISQPDAEMRLEILQVKARQRGFDGRIPLEVLEMLAEETAGNIRELEGALNKLIASAMLASEAPTVQHAEQVLEQTRANLPAITLADIIFAVAEYFGVDPEDLTGRGRAREVSGPRQIAMYLAQKETTTSLQQIGDALGGRNHSTVLYACERVADLAATDTLVRRDIQAILGSIRPQNIRLHRD
jgi:chromosomal replication initiator protein